MAAAHCNVALHPEGVDRNLDIVGTFDESDVALHPEGVDRNRTALFLFGHWRVALHPEGVDRNNARSLYNYDLRESPSTRRAWIEIGEDQLVGGMW